MHNSIKEIADPAKIEIRESDISGMGTFALKRIAPFEYIFTLSGELINTSPDVDHLCQKHGITGDDPLQIGDELFLVCNHASKTINHSCYPNTGLRNESDMYAIREILPGDEITYDYSTTSGINDTWTMSCGCSAEVCRKVVGNALTIPIATLTKYKSLNILPDFIKRQLRKAGKLL